ncbi:MAG TPA: NAD(P)-dependent oxidoreductase [Acidimicrobiales bacterium]|nr:NAD(P)-dependent oxidoreductase [Acidimicrobiales bacterium]
MRVLVTGGAGFIGTSLCRRLMAEGHEVVVADLNPPRTEVTSAVEGDLRDPSVLDKALAEGTEAVIHLAAATSVLQSVKDPVNVYRSNVELMQNLLESARRLGVASVVFASTNAVVGSGAGGGLIDERSPLVPLTPYGATKAAGEMLMSAYHHAYGLNASALRLTNVYGPGMWVKDTMVARIMKAARAGTGIRIHGDGLLSRDYVYIDDVVGAFVSGLAPAASGPALPPTVVVGSGVSVTVNDLHRLACQATGVDIPAEHVEGPPGEMRAVVVDRSLGAGLWPDPPVQLSAGLVATWRAWPE